MTTSKTNWKAVLVLPLLLGGAAAYAAEAPSWLHVQVTEGGAKDTKVSVNLPLTLVSVALDAVNEEHLEGGRTALQNSGVKVADLRRLWNELKNAGDVELVKVEERDQSVRVERKGDRVLVHVADKRAGAEKVRVDVPTGVVDALLSGEGNELNLRAAVAELQHSARGEFINVNDGDSHVRVWID